jgi:hypothetical protein
VLIRRLLLPLVVVALAAMTVPSALAGPSETYNQPHFGDKNLPAGCIVDRDPLNPDNLCYHMKVGLNALDSPKVDVDVLLPVSPAAERDMRIATQAVQMWDDGLHYLADQMDLDWLDEGLDMNVRTHLVGVNAEGLPEDPIDLIDPEIVVVVSNPAGGIGIGIDPTAFVGELGLFTDDGLPCADIANPFSMKQWQATEGFQEHSGEPGGIYVEDCGGVGGNVCFAVNGAVDPVPGLSDFFPLFDLVSHEFGHCLTVGHVGDGADGPWGPTPTNDIMAYSTDPPLLNKCVSTLDVEGFALRMSRYLDTNGDGKVTDADVLVPNDEKGDGTSSFQVQHPADHWYASSTGLPGDCPQPDLSLVPGAEGDFMPDARPSTRPKLTLGKVTTKGGTLAVRGSAERVPLAKQPTRTSASSADGSGDSVSTITDIKNVTVSTTRTTVDATIKVGKLYPVQYGTSLVAYSLTVDGRRFDSFIPTGGLDGKPVLLDNGSGTLLPPGSTTWDAATDTVKIHVRRDYLNDAQVKAPYNVYAVTGYHSRTNDWIANDDFAPNARNLDVAAPKLGKETRDAPKAKRKTSKTYQAGSGSFTPNDSTLGLSGLVSAVDNKDYKTIPVALQSSALVTLRWEGDAFLDLTVAGGSSQKVVSDEDAVNEVQILVPWARRDLQVVIDPSEVLSPTDYTLTVKRTTVVADKDADGVPNVADKCKTAAGPSAGAGCPDTDADSVFDKRDDCPTVAGIGYDGCPTKAGEKVVAFVDGKKVRSSSIFTKHGEYDFDFAIPVKANAKKLVLKWYEGGKVVKKVSRTI